MGAKENRTNLADFGMISFVKRRVFNSLVVVSALLCVALAAMWGRSYFRSDSVMHEDYSNGSAEIFQRVRYISSNYGQIQFDIFRIDLPTTGPFGAANLAAHRKIPTRSIIDDTPLVPWEWEHGSTAEPSIWFSIFGPQNNPSFARRIGFGFSDERWADGSLSGPVNFISIDLRVPYWFLTLLTLILPAAWLRRRRTARRRARAGCCRACGYDLRATPERCPECGAVASVPV